MGGKGGEGSGDKVRVYVNLHTGNFFFFQQPKADNKWLNSLIWRGRPGCLCVCLSLSLSLSQLGFDAPGLWDFGVSWRAGR